jgi:hypothetical protein
MAKSDMPAAAGSGQGQGGAALTAPAEAGAQAGTEAGTQAGTAQDQAQVAAAPDGRAGREAAAAAGKGAEAQEGDDKQARAEVKVSIVLHHKTPYPRYRCAGLVLTQKPETYQATALQIERLRRDPWVEMTKAKA